MSKMDKELNAANHRRIVSLQAVYGGDACAAPGKRMLKRMAREAEMARE